MIPYFKRFILHRDLFKKIRDTKGTFHAKMGTIKDRNGMDLTETEDTKNRWQDMQKNCTKKIFTTQIINDDVVTDLEPDILECEVKWALESITMNKASGGDGIPVSLSSNTTNSIFPFSVSEDDCEIYLV